MEPLFILTGIDKSFHAIHAVDSVDMEIYPGEIVSMVGENGAGKSTLSKIIAGVYQMDSGSFQWESQPIDTVSHDVARAKKMGISMIFQETNLVPHLNVAENIFLGREPQRIPQVINYPELHANAKREMETMGISIDTYTPVHRLSQGYKQQVEIIKTLSLHPKLIIMDEPTSSLSIEDSKNLLRIVKGLKEKGISIIYISHKLDEVLEISDRIIVMRDGKKVEEKPAKQMNKESIVKAMIGRDIHSLFAKGESQEGTEIFRVENFKNKYLSEPVSFSLKRGEILGFAGLVGAGRTEFMQSIFGVIPKQSGEIYLEDKQIYIRSPVDAIGCGIGYLPEDRREQGLILPMRVKDNILLSTWKKYSRCGCRNAGKENRTAGNSVEQLKIKTSSIETRALNLSGGNQQKIVFAKWLLTSLKVLILDEPTRGIDIGAKAEIHRLVSEMAQAGMGIIMVSSEMEEIIGMCDRVIVLRKGKMAGEVTKGHISEESIMQLAAHAN